MTQVTAADTLRALVRTALWDAGISQAEAARQLDMSTKHMSQMLNGKAGLSLDWAEQILGLCGHRLIVRSAPIPRSSYVEHR
jgi:hypothetical protein